MDEQTLQLLTEAVYWRTKAEGTHDVDGVLAKVLISTKITISCPEASEIVHRVYSRNNRNEHVGTMALP